MFATIIIPPTAQSALVLIGSVTFGGKVAMLVAGFELFLGSPIASWRVALLWASVTLVLSVVPPTRFFSTAALLGAAGYGWGSVRFIRQPDRRVRAVGWLVSIKALQLIAFTFLSEVGYTALGFLTSHFFALIVGISLLYAGVARLGERLRAANNALDLKNLELLRQQDELVRSNESLSALAVELERKNAEYAEARDRASAASHAKSQFLAMMSHELRTPLNAVIGFSEILLTEAEGQPELSRRIEFTEHVRDAGRALLSLVNDVLDAATVEANAIAPTIRPTKLVDLVQTIEERFLEMAARKNITVSIDVSETLEAPLDFRLMRQALNNLLSNAIKFTPPLGYVTIYAQPLANGTIAIGVVDSGPGISPVDKTSVFEPFWQKDDVFTRKEGGIGLGLSLVKAIVDAHHGTVEVADAPSGGTHVVMTLPASTHEKAAAA